jgi:hypothetical protein
MAILAPRIGALQIGLKTYHGDFVKNGLIDFD